MYVAAMALKMAKLLILILRQENPIVKQTQGMNHNITSCRRLRFQLVHQKTGAYKKHKKPLPRQSDKP